MTITMKRALSIAAAALLFAALLVAPGAALAATGDVTVSGGEHTLTISADAQTKGSTTLTATCATDGAHTCSWSSSNTDAATVSNGVVTAVGVGDTTITATCQTDTDNSGTWAISVTQSSQNVVVTVNDDSMEINGTKEITASISPTGIPGEYRWSVGSGDLTIPTASTTNAVTVRSGSNVGSATLNVTFVPSNAGGTNYTGSSDAATIAIQNTTPTLSVSASPASFTETNKSGTVTATTANYTPTSYVWSISGDSVRFSANGGTSITTSTNTVSFVTQGTEGNSTISCTVSGGAGTAPAAQSATVSLDLPDPYLAVWLDHDTLTWLRPKTEAHAELHYPNGTVTNDSRIYWSSSNTKIATVSGVYDHLERGNATAVVRAKANGTTTITAYTSHQRVYDSASLLVTGYKHLPQSGQDTRLLYVEGAALLALLTAAGIVYARRRKNSENQ